MVKKTNMKIEPLEQLTGRSLSELKKINTLYVSDKYLTVLPEELWELTKLKCLEIYCNNLKEIPSKIGNLVNLKHLYLINGNITKLPKEIGNLTKLENLHLTNNKLEKLPKEIGNLTNLEYLYLSKNRLSKLPKEIYNLTNLILLDLSYNKLTRLSKKMKNLSCLVTLNLESNRLTKFPEEIGEIDSMKYLTLNDYDFNITEIKKSKTYYKITNDTERHRGLQYKTGIIKDILPFDDEIENTCTPGRMYFTDIFHIFSFYGDYGTNIRPIKLLKDSRVVTEWNKYGTDTFEMLPKITLSELIKRYNKAIKKT